nr:hypothetical transcript [Hymenolepis microstoma]
MRKSRKPYLTSTCPPIRKAPLTPKPAASELRTNKLQIKAYVETKAKQDKRSQEMSHQKSKHKIILSRRPPQKIMYSGVSK